ncbi:MAG: hypothetical protein ACXVHX_36225 [Solirubrobacteraceae bacterium]
MKSRARTAHLPAELLPKLSGHSLRAGYTTAAAAAGIEERKIANVTATRTRVRGGTEQKLALTSIVGSLIRLSFLGLDQRAGKL